MLRSLFLALGLSLFFSTLAQTPTDILKIKSPNETYLEHLIKIKIDSVRKTHNLPQLANDSGLYVVSKFHCDYLSENNKTSHAQLNDTLQTPDQRLQYFGIENYLTTELVQSIYVHRPVNIRPNPNERTKLKATFKTYESVANYFVTQWSLHRKTKDDFINEKFNVIGLAVTINQTNDNIKVVAFLGRPFLKYKFTENKEMFPYSKYQTREPLNSFDEIEKTIVEDRPFKIDLSSESKCKKCNLLLKGVDLQLNVGRSKIYITADNIENTEGFDKFLSSSKNGFMLETIEYEDYHPGNPEYFERPSRRNKTYIYNGDISSPQFGNELIRGFKPEKNTFKAYLAKNPKLNTLHEFNVYIVYKGKVCALKRFTSPVGDPLALYNDLELEYQFEDSYTYHSKIDTTEITFPFKEKKFVFNKKTVQSSINKNKNYNVKTVLLAIEEPVTDYNLETPLNFDTVALNLIAQVKQQLPNASIQVQRTPNTTILKKHFAIKKEDSKSNYTTPDFQTLFENPEEIKNNSKPLKASWKATLTYVSYQDTLLDLESLYLPLITKLDTTPEPNEEEVKLATALHSAMIKQSLAQNTPLNPKTARIPNKSIYKTIITNQVAYNYNTISSHSEDTLDFFYERYIKPFYETSEATLIDKVNFLKFSCNHLTNRPFDNSYRSNNLTADLEKISSELSPAQYLELEKEYDIKLTYYYSHYSKAASKLESSIENLKKVYGQGDLETKYKLARTLAYYGKMEDVNEILTPYLGEGSKAKNMIVLYNKINQEYITVFDKPPTSYYQSLISSYQNLGKQKWCNQFVGPGNISFQIFDYLPIYQKYCQECAPYNNAGTLQPY